MKFDLKEFLNRQPKKRSAGGALIFNTKGELLLVKPRYKDYWMMPGGMTDEYESPKETCEREIKEELGLGLKVGRLLTVDYKCKKEMEDESIVFFFLLEGLGEEKITEIQIQEDELEEYRFVSREEAIELVGGGTKDRLPQCFKAIDNNCTYYLEQGLEK